jgi:hypothetical protein
MNYLNFVMVGRSGNGKTIIIDVTSISGYRLGIIKWFGRWRQYCFFPEPQTVFSEGCLQEISEYLRGLK